MSLLPELVQLLDSQRGQRLVAFFSQILLARPVTITQEHVRRLVVFFSQISKDESLMQCFNDVIRKSESGDDSVDELFQLLDDSNMEMQPIPGQLVGNLITFFNKVMECGASIQYGKGGKLAGSARCGCVHYCNMKMPGPALMTFNESRESQTEGQTDIISELVVNKIDKQSDQQVPEISKPKRGIKRKVAECNSTHHEAGEMETFESSGKQLDQASCSEETNTVVTSVPSISKSVNNVSYNLDTRFHVTNLEKVQPETIVSVSEQVNQNLNPQSTKMDSSLEKITAPYQKQGQQDEESCNDVTTIVTVTRTTLKRRRTIFVRCNCNQSEGDSSHSEVEKLIEPKPKPTETSVQESSDVQEPISPPASEIVKGQKSERFTKVCIAKDHLPKEGDDLPVQFSPEEKVLEVHKAVKSSEQEYLTTWQNVKKWRIICNCAHHSPDKMVLLTSASDHQDNGDTKVDHGCEPHKDDSVKAERVGERPTANADDQLLQQPILEYKKYQSKLELPYPVDQFVS